MSAHQAPGTPDSSVLITPLPATICLFQHSLVSTRPCVCTCQHLLPARLRAADVTAEVTWPWLRTCVREIVHLHARLVLTRSTVPA